MKSKEKWIAVLLAVIIVVGCIVFYLRNGKVRPDAAPQSQSVVALPVTVNADKSNQKLKEVSNRPKVDSVIEMTEAQPQKAERVPIPPARTDAVHKVWVKAKYGPEENELGYRPYIDESAGEQIPPQGFAVTKDGTLLVLDTFKQRLVHYDKSGNIEKSISLEEGGFVRPSDVDIAEDGTIAVLDADAGEQPAGLILFDSEGNIKTRMPNVRPETETAGLYAVGNDFYLDNQNWGSRKIADSNGNASSEPPSLHTQQENGMIPGWVAPDGVTAVSAGINDRDTGEFFITVIRGNKPEHIFTRFYLVPPQLLGLPFAGTDGQGRLYAVLYYTGKLFVACFDGQTGDPVGQVEMPLKSGEHSGRPFRQFRVVESGGLIYQVLSDTGSSYEWFNCHP